MSKYHSPHARAGSGDLAWCARLIRGIGRMSGISAFGAVRATRSIAGAALLLVGGLGSAGSAWAGSLPEPIIDPTMAAADAQRAAPGTEGATAPAAANRSSGTGGRTALAPSAVSGPMPQRQLATSFQPAPVPPGALKGSSSALSGINRAQGAAVDASANANVVPHNSAGAATLPPANIAADALTSTGPGATGSVRMSAAPSLPPPSPLESSLQETLQTLALAGARQVAPASARVEVELGRLDPRLRLAPCEQIQPYLPPNQRMWGRTRIGIRCLSGPTKWNVSLPLTIRVFAPAYVAVTDLPVGTELTQERLRLAETDIAGEVGVIFTQPEAWVGRHLAKGLMAGEALRSTDLKLRQWVQPGDRVQVQAAGNGYAVSGEGQAMGVGLEGQDVRIRFDNGRMVTGRTVGERKVEVLL
ncbi:flagella basal body P-ring formation protein FlgA [Roseateles depolymerans]|uniref:Uncharacterized protein n=2 Tax=Roseateles depolymerans TaxID=76731 RepID=A0A0U3MD47_9BURK|nr:hypothetical protein RD2015_1784 [Roseateles depolymerans]REG19235.1 flagella basal body P-ring formation protein FlgA [Roseateles depolymerans]